MRIKRSSAWTSSESTRSQCTAFDLWESKQTTKLYEELDKNRLELLKKKQDMGDEITVVFTRLSAVRSAVFTAAVLQNGRLWPGSRLGLAARYYSMSRSERNTLLSVSLCLPLPPLPPLTRTDLLYYYNTGVMMIDRPPLKHLPRSLDPLSALPPR